MEDKKNIDDILAKVKYNPDLTSHLTPELKKCKICSNRICTYVCPADVYEWDEELQTLNIKFENCLECGACRICCNQSCSNWKYPEGSYGVTFKNG